MSPTQVGRLSKANNLVATFTVFVPSTPILPPVVAGRRRGAVIVASTTPITPVIISIVVSAPTRRRVVTATSVVVTAVVAATSVVATVACVTRVVGAGIIEACLTSEYESDNESEKQHTFASAATLGRAIVPTGRRCASATAASLPVNKYGD